jgi:GH18 family chitinase
MKKIYLVLALVGLFQLFSLDGFSQLRSVGYIPTWKYDCYQTVDYSALTHLNIAFCNPDKEGNMQNPFRGNPQAFHDIVKKAHENGVKVIASLGGGGGGKNYPALIETPEGQTAFCEKKVRFVV